MTQSRDIEKVAKALIIEAIMRICPYHVIAAAKYLDTSRGDFHKGGIKTPFGSTTYFIDVEGEVAELVIDGEYTQTTYKFLISEPNFEHNVANKLHEIAMDRTYARFMLTSHLKRKILGLKPGPNVHRRNDDLCYQTRTSSIILSMTYDVKPPTVLLILEDRLDIPRKEDAPAPRIHHMNYYLGDNDVHNEILREILKFEEDFQIGNARA